MLTVKLLPVLNCAGNVTISTTSLKKDFLFMIFDAILYGSN
jgi:hypothetical protein